MNMKDKLHKALENDSPYSGDSLITRPEGIHKYTNPCAIYRLFAYYADVIGELDDELTRVANAAEVRITRLEEKTGELEERLETEKNKNWIAMFLLADTRSELSETRWLLRMVVSDLYGIEAETIKETQNLLVDHIVERDGLFQ